MPVERVTLPVQVWRKLESCAKRDKHAALKTAMDGLQKVTTGSTGAQIVWEPTQEFKDAARAALTEELTFMRKPDSATYKFIQQAIDNLN